MSNENENNIQSGKRRISESPTVVGRLFNKTFSKPKRLYVMAATVSASMDRNRVKSASASGNI